MSDGDGGGGGGGMCAETHSCVHTQIKTERLENQLHYGIYHNYIKLNS